MDINIRLFIKDIKQNEFDGNKNITVTNRSVILEKKYYTINPPVTRVSRGLEQFFFDIRDMVGLSILDLAGATQENINFLTNLGHKIYSQDIVRSIDEAFGPDPAEQNKSRPHRIFFEEQLFRLPRPARSTARCSGIRFSSWGRPC